MSFVVEAGIGQAVPIQSVSISADCRRKYDPGVRPARRSGRADRQESSSRRCGTLGHIASDARHSRHDRRYDTCHGLSPRFVAGFEAIGDRRKGIEVSWKYLSPGSMTLCRERVRIRPQASWL